MLIGVDHGNKQIKTVHCNPFVSGLKQSVTRPFGQNVLRYAGISRQVQRSGLTFFNLFSSLANTYHILFN